ncbi:MAG: GAF domain-containing protein [Thermoleophilaceae bacterium]
MAADRSTRDLVAELERVRLENETLSGVVGVVASGPDLAHILDRVVDLLTRATSSHACFVYLRSRDELRLRAASPVYSHLVGRISFGADQGLAGWTMVHGKAAFIREGAIDDPRTIYVPELEEERFQSMVAVPIPARSGESIGAIVLHTVAPREFDEGIINVLSRAASLVAGAIENARLYEQARERVEALTRLAGVGREIAAVVDRESLYRVATEGVRDMLGADAARLYELDPDERPRRVAASPATAPGEPDGEAGVVLDLLEAGPPKEGAGADALAVALSLPAPPASVAAVSLLAGGERLGVLLAAAREPWTDTGNDLVRAAAHQVALALEKIQLIERLTEENLAGDLFDALACGQLELAAARARAVGIDLDRPHVLLEARPRTQSEDELWSELGETAEHAIRRALPGTVCDLGPTALRALTPATGTGVDPARRATAGLVDVAAAHELVIGASEARSGVADVSEGMREAHDAATIATALLDRGGVLLYRDTGAYRYLIDLLEAGGPRDHLRRAVEQVTAYDRERRTQLLLTLDEYLGQGRSAAATARALTVHANTLRQRLERIETLTGLSLGEEDLLALQLAVKLARVRA